MQIVLTYEKALHSYDVSFPSPFMSEEIELSALGAFLKLGLCVYGPYVYYFLCMHLLINVHSLIFICIILAIHFTNHVRDM